MMLARTVLIFLIGGIIFSVMGACAGPSAEQNAASTEEGGVLGLILEEPSRFESITVTVTGVFQGWRGPCLSGPPVSRSDWMIADPSGCLYVHGPVPPGLDSAKPAGEKISVIGVVRLKKGQPYIDSSAAPAATEKENPFIVK
jgi:hypothetical protein